jgi:hypothetical protein
MKHPMLRVASALALCAAAGFAGQAAAQSVSARLKGYEEVPSVSTPATGSFKATIDEKAGTINYELSYQNLEGEVRMAHIHFAQRGFNGGIMVWLCQTVTNPDPTAESPVCVQSGTVTGTIRSAAVVGPAAQGIDPGAFAEVVAALKGRVGYVNVHSAKFTAGEIRGQVRLD